MKKTFFVFTAGLCLFYNAQVAGAKTINQTKADTTEINQSIAAVNKQYGDAFLKGDSSLFLNAYAPAACLFPANSPPLCGELAQLAFYRFLYKAGVRNIIFNTLNLYGITDKYATEEGSFETFGANNISLGKGKYLAVWKKTPAGWKMYRDMFSSNAPPAKQSK